MTTNIPDQSSVFRVHGILNPDPKIVWPPQLPDQTYRRRGRLSVQRRVGLIEIRSNSGHQTGWTKQR
ncbi:hypothetical protein RRG08_011294 [Elysia crispata]|uniref:Uncharacterized protein n=1 Tax=Elysia crispata TaxID=231223 RepID=A0AAE0Z8Q9_9GAST|nr:hypothetical protein RRG08_011294 [Elysia crispata]